MGTSRDWLCLRCKKNIVPVVEHGVQVRGLLEGIEHIPFTREDPTTAITKAAEFLKSQAAGKAQREQQGAIIAGLLIFFGLLGLAALASGGRGRRS